VLNLNQKFGTLARIGVPFRPARFLSACLPLACAPDPQSVFPAHPLTANVLHPRKVWRTVQWQGLPARVHFLFLFFVRIAAVTKLYVGNLPFTATEDSVRALFAAHGTVEKVSLITDRDTGRPRGFGFVEMSNSDASRAMQALNGQDFGGRPLKVNEAQERSGGGGGGRGGPRRF